MTLKFVATSRCFYLLNRRGNVSATKMLQLSAIRIYWNGIDVDTTGESPTRFFQECSRGALIKNKTKIVNTTKMRI